MLRSTLGDHLLRPGVSDSETRSFGRILFFCAFVSVCSVSSSAIAQVAAPAQLGQLQQEKTPTQEKKSAKPPAPLDVTQLTPRTVFLAALQRLEKLPYRQRFAELTRFIDECHAAIVSGDVKPESVRQRRRTLLLGLGLLFDTSELLEKTPLTRRVFRGSLTEGEKKRRRNTCEMVLLNGRPDASKHFFMSAAITAVLGPVVAERLGRNKEISDARRRETDDTGQGFSFNDLAHDIAGIRYAMLLLEGDAASCAIAPPKLPRCAPSFSGLSLPEGLDWSQFQKRYYGEQRSQYDKIVRTIHATLDQSLKLP